ncbi:MAG: hypothetical protein H6707_02750 [Deltaproteobacteria bacterium]|nr:hypothetical protein [Deltaproteobacteria bacterium]
MSPTRLLASALATVSALAACSSAEIPSEGQPQPTITLPQPSLTMVGPTAVAAGQVLTIMGQGFASPAEGATRIRFNGTYQTTTGNSYPVDIEVQPRFINQGMIEWTFGPNVAFAPAVEETGQFRGLISAINVGHNGEQKVAAQTLSSEIRVLPSIIIRQLRPLHQSCAVGITATTDATPMLFELRAIGLTAGTAVAPLRFGYTFLSQHFRPTGTLSDKFGADPESLIPKQGAITIIDDVTDGDVSMLGADNGAAVHVAEGRINENLGAIIRTIERQLNLNHIETTPIPPEAQDGYYDASMIVRAVDKRGYTAERTIDLRVWAPIQVDYDGNATVRRSFDPVPVSGCLPGGRIGREVSYNEMDADIRARAYKISGKVDVGADILVRINASFAMDVTEEVSSTTAQQLKLDSALLPNHNGVFYRQRLQLERRADLIQHTGCGRSARLSEVIVTDWVWSPDLAQARGDCPPFPPSNLPAGREFP